MSNQPKSKSSLNATSSQVSESGLMRFALPDGTMTDPFGLDRAPVNLSATQAKEMGLMMSGTSGHTGFTSSISVALSQSLVSRLQAQTASIGSTLFKLTWKTRVTPAQRLISALRASALRTSDKDCGLSQPEEMQLKGWATPSARDWKDTAGMNMTRECGKTRFDQLGRQVFLTHWPTPNANSWKGAYTDPEKIKARKEAGRQQNLQDMARLTATGKMQSGSTAKTESIGQLNPTLARWLMGLPQEWDDCAPMETPSSRKRQKNS